jgi:hypothetical protein
MDNTANISIREFARQLGVSDTSIHKAIKAGKIVKGLDRTNPRKPINYAIAIVELKGSYAPMKVQNTALDKVMNEPIAKKEPVKLTPKPQYKKPFDDDSDIPEDVEDDGEGDDQEKTIKVKNRATYNEAKRVEAVVKARTAQLEYEQLKGKLVDSKEVYKELFAVGQTVRAAMQGIPDKYLDNLLACDSRSEAHELLTKAITQALEELSNATKEVEL